MKIRFPKQIKIGDTVLKVIQDKKRVGGEFYYWDNNKKKITGGKLIIGTKLLKACPSRVLGTIIHELKEIIQIEQGTRFTKEDQKDTYEFHYDHCEHTDLCSRLVGLLIEFLE